MLPNQEQLTNEASEFIEQGVFAILAVKPVDGEAFFRPIGGSYGSGIRDAVQEMAEKYPGCKMRLFESTSEHKYFVGIVPREQVLPYADYSPETKAALERLRANIPASRRDLY